MVVFVCVLLLRSLFLPTSNAHTRSYTPLPSSSSYLPTHAAKEYSSFLSATSMPLAPRVCSKNPLSSEDCTQLSGTMDLPAGTYYLVCRPPSQPLLSRPYTAEDRWLVCVKLSMSAAVLGKLPATARSASANVVSKHAKSAHQSSTGQDCIGR